MAAKKKQSETAPNPVTDDTGRRLAAYTATIGVYAIPQEVLSGLLDPNGNPVAAVTGDPDLPTIEAITNAIGTHLRSLYGLPVVVEVKRSDQI